MYFGYRQTLRWCLPIADLALTHPSVVDGSVRLVVLPSYPVVSAAQSVFRGTGVHVGAQNLCAADSGPHTGEVGGPLLREIGCTYVEVGHAERRRLYGEDLPTVAAKAAAAVRNGLTPIICVGEPAQVPGTAAAEWCLRELDVILAGLPGAVVVAYEPYWAIGATAPAPDDHVATVCAALADRLRDRPGSRVIYGGSAGPGQLSRLGDAVDGLFLGRSAHNPSAVAMILDECANRFAAPPACS
jgi:triosephosphate isomerase